MDKIHVGMLGDSLVVEDGGEIQVKSGGRIRIENGGTASATGSVALADHTAQHTAMGLVSAFGALSSTVNALAVLHLYGSGAPVDYTDGDPPATGEGVAAPNAIYSDISVAGGGFVYRNSGTQVQPVWTKLADSV